jgi:heme O synthase-like polyprenyltransferase
VLQPSERERVRLTLNTDGRAHPVENVLAVATLLCGIVAFVSTFWTSAHAISAWFGTLGFGVGLYSQYVSATTPQRSLNIVGLVGSFVGAALGIAHGGFLPH